MGIWNLNHIIVHVDQSVVSNWGLHLFQLHLFHWKLHFVKIVYLKYKIIELIDLFAPTRHVEGECKVTIWILLIVAHCFLLWQLWRSVLHERWRIKTFCIFLLMHGLTTIFLVHELGIKDQQIASSRIQSYLWCLVKDEIYQSKSRTLDKLEQQILYILPLEILRKSIDSTSQFAEVWAKCLGLCFKIAHEP